MCHGRSTENGLNPCSAAARHLRNVVRALYNRGQRSSLRAERAARLGLLSCMAGAATEFETYLKLAPEGPNAATAKSLVAQLKK